MASILFVPLFCGCDSFLGGIESLTKVSPEVLMSSEAGLKTLLAEMYNGIPMEDFNYTNSGGFNRNSDIAEYLRWPSTFTDEAVANHLGSAVGPGGYNMWSSGTGGGNVNHWDRNRKVNLFLKSIQEAKDNDIITDEQYNRLWSEAHFARAYLYFGMVKRFGGIPIIDWLQDDDYKGDPEPLFIPRNTELETWRFVMDCCDKAIQYLPTPDEFRSDDGDPMWRASKWAAYALKSRAALYAASIAKYGDRVSFPPGEAVNRKLVGLDASEAAFFYSQCIAASKEIIDNGGYALYMPNPGSPEAAATNYQNLFMNPVQAKVEVILGKTYIDGSVGSAKQGHQFDQNFSPAQAHPGFLLWGRLGPSLNHVDLYEDYTDDGTGKSVPIVTRTDGNESYVINTNTPGPDVITAIPFVKYDSPLDAFQGRDARLRATVILPGSQYKGTTIVMQGGLISKDGSSISLYGGDPEVGYDGNMYYVFGGANLNDFSGYANMSMAGYENANYSTTGFTIRKFLAEDKTYAGDWNASYTPWIDFRLAEIYLNYAEAVVESGTGDATAAASYINALRRRAGHTDQIPLTIDNVQKERRIELAFEQHRMWDMWRRREYHTMYNNFRRKSLVQMVDLREQQPKYVFIRIENFQDIRAGGQTFQIRDYYQNIPGINVSGLINNPGRE